jgi:hypothetical protein
MLVAYEDLGFKIADIPPDDPRVPSRSIDTHANAEKVLAWAKVERPEITWRIVGDGPFGVHGRY